MVINNFLGTQTKLTINLVKMFVWPEKENRQNVVGKVDWSIKFERGGFESSTRMQTMLELSADGQFIDINQLTDDVVLGWVLSKQGGDEFLSFTYTSFHDERLTVMAKEAGLVPWNP